MTVTESECFSISEETAKELNVRVVQVGKDKRTTVVVDSKRAVQYFDNQHVNFDFSGDFEVDLCDLMEEETSTDEDFQKMMDQYQAPFFCFEPRSNSHFNDLQDRVTYLIYVCKHMPDAKREMTRLQRKNVNQNDMEANVHEACSSASKESVTKMAKAILKYLDDIIDC